MPNGLTPQFTCPFCRASRPTTDLLEAILIPFPNPYYRCSCGAEAYPHRTEDGGWLHYLWMKIVLRVWTNTPLRYNYCTVDPDRSPDGTPFLLLMWTKPRRHPPHSS